MRRFKFIGIFLLMVLLLATNFLFSQKFELIPGKSPGAIRTLRIKIVADQGYQKLIPNWQEEITHFVERASSALASQTGIELKIVWFENWQRDTNGYADRKVMLIELFGDFPRRKDTNFDVVIGLTSHYLQKARASTLEHLGCILITNKSKKVLLDENGDVKTKDYPLTPFSKRKRRFPNVILHELGHIFGCYHTDNMLYVMFEEAGHSRRFCKENTEIIKKYKWRKFHLSPLKNLIKRIN